MREKLEEQQNEKGFENQLTVELAMSIFQAG